MDYVSLSDFIKNHLRYKQHWNKKTISMSDAQWQTLSNDTFLDGSCYAQGSQFKVFETTNFGWVVFGPETKSPNGHVPNKRILKW